MAEHFTRDELRELIAEAISSAADDNMSSADYADAVLAGLEAHGLGLVDTKAIRATAANLERYPFDSVIMGEAGVLCSKALLGSSYLVTADDLVRLSNERTSA
jgi:hypothetical protein